MYVTFVFMVFGVPGLLPSSGLQAEGLFTEGDSLCCVFCRVGADFDCQDVYWLSGRQLRVTSGALTQVLIQTRSSAGDSPNSCRSTSRLWRTTISWLVNKVFLVFTFVPSDSVLLVVHVCRGQGSGSEPHCCL